MAVLYITYIWFYSILVKLSGDVEENPGPDLSRFKAYQSATESIKFFLIFINLINFFHHNCLI